MKFEFQSIRYRNRYVVVSQSFSTYGNGDREIAIRYNHQNVSRISRGIKENRQISSLSQILLETRHCNLPEGWFYSFFFSVALIRVEIIRAVLIPFGSIEFLRYCRLVSFNNNLWFNENCTFTNTIYLP